jgi:hypothetical protein
MADWRKEALPVTSETINTSLEKVIGRYVTIKLTLFCSLFGPVADN